MRKLSPGDVKSRAIGLHNTLRPFELSQKSVAHLVSRRVTAQKAARRIRVMANAGVPLTGLVFKLRLSEPEFRELVERYRSRHGLSPYQQRAFDFLAGKHVSRETALSLVRRPQGRPMTLESLKKKFEFFESIKLDPAIYGVERIPVSCFAPSLCLPLNKLKGQSLKKRILYGLQDSFAEKKLARIFPEWKSLSILKGIRASNVLEKVEAAFSLGIRPGAEIISRFSASRIRGLSARTPNSLDEAATRQHVARLGFFGTAFKEPPEALARRALILDAIIARPYLSVKTGWLKRKLLRAQGMKEDQFNHAIEELMDLGVVSSQNGYLTISKWFRTGTKGPEEHRKATGQMVFRMAQAAVKTKETKAARSLAGEKK